MYCYPYLPKTQPPLHSTFEIDGNVRVQEKKAVDLAVWYINKMSSQVSSRPVPFGKLFMMIARFRDWLHVAPQRELAHSPK